jgi:hypothetical protein
MSAQPDSEDAGRESLRSDLRRIDQMVSMESVLRDRALRFGLALTIVVLVASAATAALAFAADEQPIIVFGISTTSAFIIAVVGLVAFIASLLDLVLRRGEKARRFATSVGRLATLKLEYRALLEAPGQIPAAQVQAVRSHYAAVMESVEAIPDGQFNRLKARHLRKVEISKLLSAHPGISVRSARRRLAARIRHNPK